jgi:hypothetical protein
MRFSAERMPATLPGAPDALQRTRVNPSQPGHDVGVAMDMCRVPEVTLDRGAVRTSTVW